MIGVNGRVQREGEVVHFVAHWIVDLSRELASVGQRGGHAFPLTQGRGDEGPPTAQAGGPPQGPQPRDIFIRDLHLDTIRLKGQSFRCGREVLQQRFCGRQSQ